MHANDTGHNRVLCRATKSTVPYGPHPHKCQTRDRALNADLLLTAVTSALILLTTPPDRPTTDNRHAYKNNSLVTLRDNIEFSVTVV